MNTKTEIVVGADGSPNSVQAVRWAVEYATAKNATVRVVSAFDIPWTIYITPTSNDETYANAAAEALESTITEAFPHGTDVALIPQVVQGRPHVALVTASKNASLLVVGSHGQGMLPGALLGSVADYCVQHALCPVVVVREAT
jgi:nucleotide-binding universal stress UspA family protein